MRGSSQRPPIPPGSPAPTPAACGLHRVALTSPPGSHTAPASWELRHVPTWKWDFNRDLTIQQGFSKGALNSTGASKGSLSFNRGLQRVLEIHRRAPPPPRRTATRGQRGRGAARAPTARRLCPHAAPRRKSQWSTALNCWCHPTGTGTQTFTTTGTHTLMSQHHLHRTVSDTNSKW